ncbi:Enamine deaminase RidA, house cleaning of reactive enamine intermediates, YjgF/YER057c/UK114 family [Massilia sp. PDC64]|nr:RidA family protein [Massilia sp. PDC64]SDD06004.1 Enamine deaminase RidA, house cleaning of reactive enamine intermediates, YjgF/YER057c/UK114 family [Massilia sp. PDC64]
MNVKSSLFAGLVAAIVAGAAHGQAIRKTNPPSVPKPVAAYSHVAEVPPGTRLLFLAGQVGNRADGSLPEGVEDQAVQALENIRLILAAQGAGPQDIAKLTFYVAAKPASLAKLNAKRAEMFAGTPPPPSTWIQVAGLARPEYLVEIEAVAAVPAATH